LEFMVRQIDSILDFLEDYGLSRPPADSSRDPRVGQIGPNEEIIRIDWRRLTGRNAAHTLAPGDTETVAYGTPPDIEADILGELGLAARQERPEKFRDSPIESPWHSCAWYSPIHYYGTGWGIYVRQNCLFELAA
jgi:hypothetical protein